ncbi:hypothetical protein GCM10027073_73950 [Streptomyces chlorus]
MTTSRIWTRVLRPVSGMLVTRLPPPLRARTTVRVRLLCVRLLCVRLLCVRLLCVRLLCVRLLCVRLLCVRLPCVRVPRVRVMNGGAARRGSAAVHPFR